MFGFSSLTAARCATCGTAALPLLSELHAHGILRCQLHRTPSISRDALDEFVGREAGISDPSLYILSHAALTGWPHGLPIDQLPGPVWRRVQIGKANA